MSKDNADKPVEAEMKPQPLKLDVPMHDYIQHGADPDEGESR